MLSDMTFGQYYPTESAVHRMDPRTKLILLIVYIVTVFVAKNFYGLAVSLVFILAAILFSRVPLRSVLKSLKGIFFLVIFTFILNVLFYLPQEGDRVLFWRISVQGIVSASFFALRIIFLVLGSSVLTLTTTPVSLTDGLESLLTPLSWLHFPVHDLALIMSIALRFIPTLAEETDRIIRAQKARGADFESGNLIRRAKALIPVLVPLLIGAFRRANELGDAMDARCYAGSPHRTKYKKLKFSYRDPIAVLATGIFLAGVILCNVYAAYLPVLF